MGCILPIPDNILSGIENEIYLFASGNLRLAKQRVFTKIENGGLGLFNVKQFLEAQTCSWIRRCSVIDQEWKARIVGAGTGNLYLSHCAIGLQNLFPILQNIISCHKNFIAAFTKSNQNFRDAYLLNNHALTVGIRTKIPLQMNDFNTEPALDPFLLSRLKNIRMADLLTPEGKISKRVFCENMGIRVNENLWAKLDKIRNTAILRYGSNEGNTVSIRNFFEKWKKGSQKVRLLLDHNEVPYIPHNMVKFAENTETVIGLELSKFLNKSWNTSFLSNDLRTFIFKLHNNTLPYNTMLSHFVPGISRNCTFCDIVLNQDEEDETPLHLFYDCQPVELLRDEFYRYISDDRTLTVTRTEFFTNFGRPNNFTNRALFLVTRLFIKFLWDCKVRKILPTQRHVLSSIMHELRVTTSLNRELKKIFENSGLAPAFLNSFLPG
jgi:hypothetical protein